MATRDPFSLAVGIALIVVGVLLLLGKLTAGVLIDVAGVVLIILGIIILIGKLPGGLLIGVAAVALGILLVVPRFGLSDDIKHDLRAVIDIINIVIGILAIIVGVMKVAGK